MQPCSTPIPRHLLTVLLLQFDSFEERRREGDDEGIGSEFEVLFGGDAVGYEHVGGSGIDRK